MMPANVRSTLQARKRMLEEYGCNDCHHLEVFRGELLEGERAKGGGAVIRQVVGGIEQRMEGAIDQVSL